MQVRREYREVTLLGEGRGEEGELARGDTVVAGLEEERRGASREVGSREERVGGGEEVGRRSGTKMGVRKPERTRRRRRENGPTLV